MYQHHSFVRSLKNSSRRLALGAAAAISLLGGAACSESTGNATSGKISVLLTDAPGDFKKAVVTISQIYLQPGDDPNAQRVILRDTPVTTDLLTLANDAASLVQDAVVPAGSYGQLRFVITGGYIEVDNGNGTSSIYASSPTYAGLPQGAVVAGNLQMPSYAQSGLKIGFSSGAVSVNGDSKVLLVDFDVSQSFGKAAGGSGQWVMTPVVKGAELTMSGSVKVTLAKDAALTMPTINNAPLTLGQFTARLTDGNGANTDVALTDANNDGVFEASFLYILPGSYTVDFVPPAGVTSFTTNPTHPISVTVSSGTQTVAATLTAAN